METPATQHAPGAARPSASRPSAAIELAGVGKTYAARRGDGFRAVERLDLTIESGEFFSLLGPSG
jgi:ABC-type Fe3+/spermidine/putrescine transport system ATPase subunit